MKTKKGYNKEQKINISEELGSISQRVKKSSGKVKYKHKNYWLEQEDDYLLPSISSEEEQ